MSRFAWGITGAGHFLADCADVIPDLPEVDLFASRAAEEVVRMYGLEEKLLQGARRFYRESRARAEQRVHLLGCASEGVACRLAGANWN